LQAATVVNDQLLSAAKRLPATSLTTGSIAPPRAVAVYCVEGASRPLGVIVATWVDAL
jgi:hypothetical protein